MATSVAPPQSRASAYAYTIQSWGKRFPVLLKTPSPKGHVELIEIIGKGNYGNVYRVGFSVLSAAGIRFIFLTVCQFAGRCS